MIDGLYELALTMSASSANVGVGEPGTVTNPLPVDGACPRCGGGVLADVSEPRSFELARQALDRSVYERLTSTRRASCSAGCDWRGYARRPS